MAKKSIKSIDWRVLVAGILALAVIECFALANGVNGVLLTSIVAIIAAAIGIALPIKTK